MNPPIRAVVFDFGGVLITPITTLLAEVAAWHDVSMVSMLDVLMGPRETSTSDHPWHRAERGELATSEMQREVVPFAEAAGLTLRGDEYQRVLSGEFTVHDAVIDRIVRLHDEGYLLGLLTNSFVEFREHLESRIDFSMFDVVVDSSEVGMRKPERGIYELTRAKLGLPHTALFFLDDLGVNLKSARALGWQTLRYDDTVRVLSVLDALAASKPERR